MTQEQLEEAKRLADEISKLSDELNDVQCSYSLALYWKNDQYSVPIELPSEYCEKVKAEYSKELEGKIAELQKQFDEL